MIVTSLLPPSYLLPAWNHAQLAVVHSRISYPRRCKRFSTSKYLGDVDRTLTTTDSNKNAGHDDNASLLQYPRTIQSYATRRRNRLERGNEEIRQRLLRTRERLKNGSATHRRRVEAEGEAKMIAEYVARKSLESSNARNARSFSRTMQVKLSTLGKFGDFGDNEDALEKLPAEEKKPTARGSDSFESPDSRLFPSYKRMNIMRRSQAPGSSEMESNQAPAIEHRDSAKGIDNVDSPLISDAQSDGTAQTQHQRSLLEELFPEEAAKLKVSDDAQDAMALRNAEPQELALPAVDDLEDNGILRRPRMVLPRGVITRESNTDKLVPALLVLENAMPNLIPADFKRVLPKGKHIEEWKSRFDPTAIIPARAHRTGECTGRYYLVFKNSGHAKQWRTRSELLHRIVKKHAVTSITAPVIPWKGFTSEGQDIGEALREYSIFSVGVDPIIRFYSDPQADPSIKDELDMIVRRLQPSGRAFRPGRSVLMWVEGWTLATHQVIKKMLTVDGRARNMPWGGWGSQDILEEYRDQIPLARDRDNDPTGSSMKVPRKWLVTLRDEAEARRFVRSWHLRPFPAWPMFKRDTHDEPWPLIRTERVW